MVDVPAACGHGFLTLEDDTEIFYSMSQFYNADSVHAVGRSGVPDCLAGESGSGFRQGSSVP
jgi:hypothetical protein